ncbi:5-deoxy-glucuronate isomerase [Leadbettera azotonutricia]|uniref:5-deoxy-glucuronate isomerase n=1 Tax=Leadbettera azotonutricia TaxID=150829 RepID=UPI0002DD4F67|nr:5-deoxy-glucuronate isomerase [Leadbettera azotonutricia]
MIIYTDKVNSGYNGIITMEGSGKLMQMDMGLLKLPQGGSFELLEPDKETALLLLDGEVVFSYKGETKTGKRSSFIDECPHCLHIPRNIKVTITTKSGCEIYIQKALNAKDFTPVFYKPEDNMVNHTGKDILDDTMHRIVRTLFDFEHAPYSNMVLGEVLSLPGRWSGYIPHTHPQPEIYFFRFHRPEGFGAGFVGENVYKLKNNSLLLIGPDMSHPQVTAPGFPMLTVWGIRHLDGNPWQRSKTPDVPEYKWILEEKK